jgi:hypothetical protein
MYLNKKVIKNAQIGLQSHYWLVTQVAIRFTKLEKLEKIQIEYFVIIVGLRHLGEALCLSNPQEERTFWGSQTKSHVRQRDLSSRERYSVRAPLLFKVEKC